MIDRSAQAFTRGGIQLTGITVLFQRVSGFAPNTVTFSAEVMARVQSSTPDGSDEAQTGYSGSRPGGISQDERQVIVMADDLARARFPLPVAKNDKVIVLATNEKFNITAVDPYKRAFAGAIECTMAGVS